MREEIIKRFEEIDTHNLALLSMRTERREEVDNLILEIAGAYDKADEKYELRFEDMTYLKTDIDFASKRVTADVMYGARCHSESPWIKSLIESNPYDNFSAYLHFEIGLIPKSGGIDLLARDFSMRRL